jgi:hypothetical protein
MEALVVGEGAATDTIKLPVTAAVPVTLIASGFGEHVTPGGRFAAGQVTLTVPVKPPLGVTVMADIPLLPAETVTAAPLTVKEPGLFTVMGTAVALEVE